MLSAGNDDPNAGWECGLQQMLFWVWMRLAFKNGRVYHAHFFSAKA